MNDSTREKVDKVLDSLGTVPCYSTTCKEAVADLILSERREAVEEFADRLKTSYLVQPNPKARLGMHKNGMKLTEYPEVIRLIDTLLAELTPEERSN